MARFLPISLVIVLAACAGPLAATPAPTLEAIYVTYPSALQPWADRLSDCAAGQPQVGLYVTVSDMPPATIQADQIVLALGQPGEPATDAFLAQVGREQITVVVNSANTVEQLSNEQLAAIFSGQLASWEGSGRPITVWVLPLGDPARTAFDQAVMQSQPVTTNAMLAPDEVAMMEAISKDAGAIGYLPEGYLNSSGTVDPGELNIVQVEPVVGSALDQPVIAITKGEPVGNVRKLVVCLEAGNP